MFFHTFDRYSFCNPYTIAVKAAKEQQSEGKSPPITYNCLLSVKNIAEDSPVLCLANAVKITAPPVFLRRWCPALPWA